MIHETIAFNPNQSPAAESVIRACEGRTKNTPNAPNSPYYPDNKSLLFAHLFATQFSGEFNISFIHHGLFNGVMGQ